MNPTPMLLNWRKPRALLEPISAESILKQTPWSAGFFRFHDEGRSYQQYVEYFNPSIVRWQGRNILVTRRRLEQYRQPGHNSLWTWTLNGLTPTNGKKVAIISGNQFMDHHEDPRATQCPDGSALLSWCQFRWNTKAHQTYGVLTPSGVKNPLHLVYGKNGTTPQANTGWEKNWVWFYHNADLMCSYIPSPEHTVLSVSKNRVRQVYKTDASAAQRIWKWGEIRGGTPPIRVGAEYVTFMHSRLPWMWKNARWWFRYYMGAICFKAEPPFEITRITRKPILEGSKHDPRNEGAPLCVFPCGSLMENGSWFVTLGVNDCRCAWIRIPHDELIREMVEI